MVSLAERAVKTTPATVNKNIALFLALLLKSGFTVQQIVESLRAEIASIRAIGGDLALLSKFKFSLDPDARTTHGFTLRDLQGDVAQGQPASSDQVVATSQDQAHGANANLDAILQQRFNFIETLFHVMQQAEINLVARHGYDEQAFESYSFKRGDTTSPLAQYAQKNDLYNLEHVSLHALVRALADHPQAAQARAADYAATAPELTPNTTGAYLQATQGNEIALYLQNLAQHVEYLLSTLLYTYEPQTQLSQRLLSHGPLF